MNNFEFNAQTRIIVEDSSKPVEWAANVLRRDMKRVFCTASGQGVQNEIHVKTGAEGAPETFLLTFSDEGGKQILTVTGTDIRGTIYGLLYLSRTYLHVPPFHFWNDTPPARLERALIPQQTYRSKPFKVRYRGFFINDEVLLLGWHDDRYDRMTWEPAFEALLRCGGNMVIPGTGEVSRHTRQLASEMGLIITHHHAEPMGAKMFLTAYPDEDPSYLKNQKLFETLWREAIEEQKDSDVIWTLGFRGQGDQPFWDDDPSLNTPKARGELISSIIKRQYDILHEYFDNPICCTNLYGEIMQLYKDGYITIPDGVIKIWADNGYARMVSRRQWNLNPRVPALPKPGDTGPHGLYYHVTFHDLQASNHLTMLPNPPSLVASELQKAFESGADEYLICNCGNIRPHTYLLDLVSKLWTDGAADVEEHLKQFTQTYFPDDCDAVAECLREYFDCPIQYGPNEDEHAGEQFYHYPMRSIISHWIKGKGSETETELLWATGNVPFDEQVAWYEEKLKSAVDRWRAFLLKCERVRASMKGNKAPFEDGVLLQAKLHKLGCEAALKFCEGYWKMQAQDPLEAYLCVSEAMRIAKSAVSALKPAEHGKWVHFYRNECMDGLRLTVYALNTTRRWIRALGDDSLFLSWERGYVWDKRFNRVLLQTTTTPQMDDDELYDRLKAARDYEER